MNSSEFQSFECLDNEEVFQIMKISMEYEMLHRKAVRRKLLHARTATAESLLNLKGELEQKSRLARKIQKYEDIWEQTLATFEKSYVSTNMLKRIEGVLRDIPSIIKLIYERLVGQDKTLLRIQDELDAKEDEYKICRRILKLVRSKVDEVRQEIWPCEDESERVCFEEVFVFERPASKSKLIVDLN